MIKLVKKMFSYQQFRFLFVGGLNTVFGYGIYALLIFLNVNMYLSNLTSTVLGVCHSYLWNRYFTFKSKDKALGEILRFISVYIISFLISNAVLYIFAKRLGIDKYIVGIINICFTTVISWFGHKYFSFKKKEVK